MSEIIKYHYSSTVLYKIILITSFVRMRLTPLQLQHRATFGLELNIHWRNTQPNISIPCEIKSSIGLRKQTSTIVCYDDLLWILW